MYVVDFFMLWVVYSIEDCLRLTIVLFKTYDSLCDKSFVLSLAWCLSIPFTSQLKTTASHSHINFESGEISCLDCKKDFLLQFARGEEKTRQNEDESEKERGRRPQFGNSVCHIFVRIKHLNSPFYTRKGSVQRNAEMDSVLFFCLDLTRHDAAIKPQKIEKKEVNAGDQTEEDRFSVSSVQAVRN